MRNTAGALIAVAWLLIVPAIACAGGGIHRVSHSALIQAAIDEAASGTEPAGTPRVVELADGQVYYANPIVPVGVTLRGESQTGTALVGTVTLSGFLETMRIVGRVVATPAPWPASASIRETIVANLSGGDDATLELVLSMAGTGALRLYGSTFTTNGTRAFYTDGMPEGAAAGMVEFISDESTRFESYSAAGPGAAVEFAGGGIVLAYLKGAMFLSQSPDVAWLKASGQNVTLHGGGVLTNAAPRPKIVQEGLGKIEAWHVGGLSVFDTSGNVELH